MLGGYCNVVLCILGLVGNFLSLAVLFRKEMKQKNNTFNNLLIGKCTGEETSYEYIYIRSSITHQNCPESKIP